MVKNTLGKIPSQSKISKKRKIITWNGIILNGFNVSIWYYEHYLLLSSIIFPKKKPKKKTKPHNCKNTYLYIGSKNKAS
jgi:hypothetical protein